MVKKKFKKENVSPFSINGDKHGKLDGFSYRQAWTEDSYIMESGNREVIGKSFDFSKLRWIFILLFACVFVLFARLAWLQVVKGDYYYQMAEGNRIRVQRIEAKRGIIYDREMRPMVRNVANFMLYFVPIDLPRDEEDKEAMLAKISANLDDMSVDEIKEKLAKVKIGSLESYQPLFIKDNIEYEKAIKLYLESAEMPGVVVQSKNRREYDLRALSLSHILGYTGKISEAELKSMGSEYLMIDYVGKMGLEYFWENELKGQSGRKQIEVDALGKQKKIMSEVSAEDGRNLVLSLDVELQAKIEEILLGYLNEKMNKASVVAMDPNNGEILALVSLPTFDNNEFARGISQEKYSELINDPARPLFNRSISGQYPAGSTIKPILVSAALEEKIISERTSFFSSGGLRIGQWFFPDWRAGGHGITDARKAIADSVNTFFYYIGGGYEDFVGLGVDRIANYFRLFGLGEQTGIDLSGEAGGFLPTREWKKEQIGEPWYIGDTYHMSIGQGYVLATPLQIANYTSVFANGGKLYRPHFVSKILSGKDEDFQEIDTTPIRENFINNYNITVARQGMRQTVTSGSATSLQAVPVAVAGKTGTAQWSSTKTPHAWFTGFAPYDNPEIVLTVLVEEGAGQVHLAVPITRDILVWYFSR